MHQLLLQQLERFLPSQKDLPESVRNFIAAVDQVYEQFDHVEKRRADELAQAESKYQHLVERLPAMVYVCATAGDGKCLYASPQVQSILGFDAQTLMDQSGFWLSHIHDEDRKRVLEEAQKAITTGSFTSEYRMIHRNGRVVHVRDEAVIYNAPDGHWFHGVVFDVTNHHEAQQALRESEQRFRTMADTAPVLVWGADVDGGFTFFNKRWLDFTGRPLTDEQGQGWLESIHPDERQHIFDTYTHKFTDRKDIRSEYRMRRHDGEFRWVLNTGVPRFSPDGTFAGYIGTCIDITDRKKAEEQLLHDAFYDGLTGLPNRALFTDRLERALSRQKRKQNYSFGVLFMDLDRFKVINDSLGHFVGDQLLVAFARRLQSCLRPNDTIARLGGDEFTILLDDLAKPEDAAIVAERIHELLNKPFAVGTEVFTTASIGIALSAGNYVRAQDLLRDADTAMYAAKNSGLGKHKVFDANMHQKAVQQLLLENDLRRAVDRSEFFNVYQPIVSLSTGRVVRFESLVRWKHPDRGMVSPMEFIPVAEETGLIVPLGAFVLEESIRQLAAWRKQFPHLPWLAINVNLSGRQFAHPHLVQRVQDMLTRYELEPKHLGLEITESVLMADPESTKLMLKRLRDLGISIYLDDFGTGYSSLGYLQQFAVDGLKIDRSFINPKEGKEGRIVHTIITMAHDLGLPVTAEGIETVEQSQKLLNLSCEYGQGYLFAKPLEAMAAEKLLVNRPVIETAPAATPVPVGLSV